MDNKPLVSIITPFFNTPPEFLQEAIQSVFGQTYPNWELILIDDGSTTPVSEIALSYTARFPGKVFIYEHADRLNKGHSAARNRGIGYSKGRYIAFLDADDVWLPTKLEQQVAILESFPGVGMLYANTQYWFSWTNDPKDVNRDFMPELGVPADSVVRPPALLPLFLNGKASVPSMNTLLVRRDIVTRHDGFDESFRSLYGDQHFYAKLCLFESVYVSGACVDRYRQHAKSTTGQANKLNTETTARRYFLDWLENYLEQKSITDPEVWRELRREIWRINLPVWLPENVRLRKIIRWVKKWILRMEERILHDSIRNRLWVPNYNRNVNSSTPNQRET